MLDTTFFDLRVKAIELALKTPNLTSSREIVDAARIYHEFLMGREAEPVPAEAPAAPAEPDRPSSLQERLDVALGNFEDAVATFSDEGPDGACVNCGEPIDVEPQAPLLNDFIQAVRINTPSGERRLKASQVRYIAHLDGGYDSIALCQREIGATTALLAYLAWEAARTRSKIIVATHALAQARRMSHMILGFQKAIGSTISPSGMQSVQFESGSTVAFTTIHALAAGQVPEDIDLLAIDNASHGFKNDERTLLLDLVNALDETDTRVVIQSSAGTTADGFYKLWADVNGPADTYAFNPFLMQEPTLPDNAPEAVLLKQRRNVMGEAAYARDYLCQFIDEKPAE